MGNQKETQKNPQYKYASTREKLCFGIGAIGKDAICNLVGAFLMLYFTDTLYLAPAFVGVLFFVARIWDAINDPMMGMIVDNNLCTQIAKSFAVYYFKCVCHDEYLYSIFGFAIIAEMAGLLCFPKIAEKISREKVYAFACGLPIVGFVLLGAAGYVAPQSKVLVIVCCALLFFGSGLSLGVTTCCMADVIDYGEVKFGVRNESVTCSAQTFLMKAAMAAAGGLTGIGLQIVGYNAKAVTQSTATVMGIRVLMIVIPIILAFASFGIYKKYYILKGEKMEEITRKVNEMHAKKQTA